VGSPFAADVPPTAPADSDNPYQSPSQYGPVRAPVAYPSTDTNATVSLILGCVGLVGFGCCGLFGVPVSLIVGSLGLWFGYRGLNSPNRGLAIAGIILCSIQLVLVLGLILLFVMMIILASLGP